MNALHFYNSPFYEIFTKVRTIHIYPDDQYLVSTFCCKLSNFDHIYCTWRVFSSCFTHGLWCLTMFWTCLVEILTFEAIWALKYSVNNVGRFSCQLDHLHSFCQLLVLEFANNFNWSNFISNLMLKLVVLACVFSVVDCANSTSEEYIGLRCWLVRIFSLLVNIICKLVWLHELDHYCCLWGWLWWLPFCLLAASFSLILAKKYFWFIVFSGEIDHNLCKYGNDAGTVA